MRDFKFLAVAAGLATAALALPAPAPAEEAVFVMHKIDGKGVGPPVGRITLRDSPDGMVLQPDLRDLPPGEHGFHFHEKPDCRPSLEDGKPLAAGRSGDHFDPDQTGKQQEVRDSGHAMSEAQMAHTLERGIEVLGDGPVDARCVPAHRRDQLIGARINHAGQAGIVRAVPGLAQRNAGSGQPVAHIGIGPARRQRTQALQRTLAQVEIPDAFARM